ncbi:MAG: LrgB family protein [Bacillota bacterium]
MFDSLLAIIVIIFTIIVFVAMNCLYIRWRYAFLLPILTSTILIIVVLSCFHISYETYMVGGQWINRMLGPAVVALAYPLYKQRHVLLRHVVPVLTSVLIGLLTGMVSGIVLARLAGLGRELVLSVLPKSITTPVAIQIASGLGGIPAMTVVAVMIAGFSGVILGPRVLSWFRIDSPLGQGVALGSASHALGISKTAEYGELSMSMSSVSMTLSAVLGSVIGPLLAGWFV